MMPKKPTQCLAPTGSAFGRVELAVVAGWPLRPEAQSMLLFAAREAAAGAGPSGAAAG